MTLLYISLRIADTINLVEMIYEQFLFKINELIGDNDGKAIRSPNQS